MTKQTRFIGIDFGMARIGIAISDTTKLIATPFKTVQAEKKIELTAKKLIAELEQDQKERKYEIEKIIVGLPLLMSGKKGIMADEVHAFIEALQQHVTIPITTWDERLTSVQAERSLRESDMNRKKRTKHVDQVSALIILQNYLDHRGLQLPNETF